MTTENVKKVTGDSTKLRTKSEIFHGYERTEKAKEKKTTERSAGKYERVKERKGEFDKERV